MWVRERLMPWHAMVEAILDLPSPKSRREVMRVLGMYGFYRRFVPNFAAVTELLTNLPKKCQVCLDWSLWPYLCSYTNIAESYIGALTYVACTQFWCTVQTCSGSMWHWHGSSALASRCSQNRQTSCLLLKKAKYTSESLLDYWEGCSRSCLGLLCAWISGAGVGGVVGVGFWWNLVLLIGSRHLCMKGKTLKLRPSTHHPLHFVYTSTNWKN